MKYLAIALATAALSGAQTPAISIRPNTAGLGGPSAMVGGRTGVPILGYIAGPGALELHAVLGTGKGAQLGSPVTLPGGTKHVFVPPREHFLLLEGNGSEPLAVWAPAKLNAESIPLVGVLGHPDVVAFSARGDATVVYGRSADRLQVIAGLPGEPSVISHTGIAKWGEIASFAVSDDGAVVVALLTDGTAVVSLHDEGWQRLPAAYGARAILFAPNTHNLTVSDGAQQTLSLLLNVGSQAPGLQLLAQNVVADRLAYTKEGDVLLAASSSQGKLWSVDVKTMTLGPASTMTIDTLLPMRDGHTFLLSAPHLSLLNVPQEGDSAAGLVPVTR